MTAPAVTTTLRQSTLETLGLGTVLDIFRNGRLPVRAGDLVGAVFGSANQRGAMVISGANGVVGAGKTMQFASRLAEFGVPIVALDFPGAPDGIRRQYPGLVRAFGAERAAEIMGSVIQLSYDGQSLPDDLAHFAPRFLLEAIPEILDAKRSHYEIFRAAYPDIEIRSVTSGFPSAELGVGIAHPAFPHEINKVFEVVEPEPSDFTRLLWALGLIPMQVSDDWSFVLDVLFCGVTLAAIRYHHTHNMPYWKIDKYVRRLLGPNPLRAHDAIGARGANFLTWSCLHHLSEHYGGLFTPAPELVTRKDTGQDWYPPDHFRPLVDWSLTPEGEEEFNTWVLGPLFQMATLMIHERRSHCAQLNLIGELCAQFRRGILAIMRSHGAEGVIATVDAYHKLFPDAAKGPWYPDVVQQMDGAEWQQLYVNAEHDGEVGVITLGRESYNSDVDAELNRAMDWLAGAKIERVIVTGDFHLTTQLVGADTAEFYPALEDEKAGEWISGDWSRTARRLAQDFRTSVAVINGKRCLGGMLELFLHCHYVLAVEDAALGFPEVTLPVIPGMEGCHWPFRKAAPADWPRILDLLLGGRSIGAGETVGWLIDYSGPIEDVVSTAWAVASDGEHRLGRRAFAADALDGAADRVPDLPPGAPATEEARAAIRLCVEASCGVPAADALTVQSRHSAGFMTSEWCRRGRVGAEYAKTMKV
jgi:enoyl-CoA hydratase/carnithine racemase/3-hydroxyacyl-CoA dehydrogenase